MAVILTVACYRLVDATMQALSPRAWSCLATPGRAFPAAED